MVLGGFGWEMTDLGVLGASVFWFFHTKKVLPFAMVFVCIFFCIFLWPC